MDSLTDLILKCQKNNGNAQRQIYNMFAPKLYGVCLQYCKNKSDADDNLQESFVKIFCNIKKFRFDGSFEGWMRRIIVNTIIESYRKKKGLYFEESVECYPDDIEEEIEHSHTAIDTQQLFKLIEQLPPKYKLVFNLYALEGLSHKEIAEILDISIGTSKSNLSRARKILKDNLSLIKTKGPLTA